MTESDFASGDWFNATNGTNSTGGGSGFQPSTPLCIGLSAFGGFLEVSSTMVLAFPEFKTKMGAWQPSKCRDRIMMVLNLVLMGVASVAYIVGSWFGPVSLSVPVVMVSKLLFNMVLMGLVLRMTSFSKDQQVGTYCIACAILTLPEVGPMDQPGADVLALIVQPVALAWISVLTLATLVCVVGMVVLARRAKRAAKLAATAKKMARQSNSPGRPSDAEPDGSAAGECVSLIVYTMAQARAQFGALRRDSAQFSDLRTRVHDGAGGVGGARHVDLEDVCARPAHARRALDDDRPLRPLRRRQRRLAHPGGDGGPHRLAARTEGAAPAALALSHLRLTTPLLPLQVDQALFVPATVMATLVFNMLTGILLWEDWKVIHQWIAYVMVRARARLEYSPPHLGPGGGARARAASCSSHATPPHNPLPSLGRLHRCT